MPRLSMVYIVIDIPYALIFKSFVQASHFDVWAKL